MEDSLVMLRNQYLKNSNIVKYKPALYNIMDLYLNFSIYYIFKKDYVNTMRLTHELFQLAKQNKEIRYQIEALKLFGVVNVELSRYQQAITNFNECLKLATLEKDTITLIDAYLGFSNLYLKKKDPKKAKANLFFALYLCNKSGRPESLAMVNKNIGSFFLSEKNYSFALYHYNQSITIYQRIPDYPEVAVLYTLIGHVYQEENKPDKSIFYNEQALKLRKILPQEDLYISSLLNLGHAYATNKKYDSAFLYLKLGIAKLTKVKNFHLSEYGFRNLFVIYVLKGDYKNALQCYRSANSMKDSLAIEKSRNIAGIQEANQKLNENEKISAALKTENELQRSQLRTRNIQIILGLVVLFFLGVTLGFVLFVLEKNRKAKKLQQEINKTMNAEISKRALLEETLKASETRYRFVTEHSPDVIIRENTHLEKSFVSPSSLAIFGYTPEELRSFPDFFEFIHPESIPVVLAGIAKLKVSRTNSRLVYRIRKKDDSYFWAESYIHPVFDEITGELAEMISVVRDISERVEQQEELEEHARHKEFLIREVNHRVKNNMSILMSMMRIHKFRIKDMDMGTLLDDLQYRVRTMALVHDQLHLSRNIDELATGPYLSTLVKSVILAFNDEQVQIDTFFFEEMVHVDILLPMGLIINEIITNSFKYAFPENKTGNIWVTYEKADEDINSNMRKLSIRDDGAGFPVGFNFFEAETMGSQMIQQLAQQLDGELLVDGSAGASFTITLPVKSGNKIANSDKK